MLPAIKHLQDLSKEIPGLSADIDYLRAGCGKGLKWTDWCFLPLQGVAEIVKRFPIPAEKKIGYISRIGALAAWRVTQGIYGFDSTLLENLISAPITKIPERKQ